jgi:hypothetical protein
MVCTEMTSPLASRASSVCADKQTRTHGDGDYPTAVGATTAPRTLFLDTASARNRPKVASTRSSSTLNGEPSSLFAS